MPLSTQKSSNVYLSHLEKTSQQSHLLLLPGSDKSMPPYGPQNHITGNQRLLLPQIPSSSPTLLPLTQTPWTLVPPPPQLLGQQLMLLTTTAWQPSRARRPESLQHSP